MSPRIALLWDVDGTLLHANDPSGVRGAQPIPGAIETVARLRASGRRLLFFTNGTGRPPAETPDLDALPDYIREPVQQCLELDPAERPAARAVVQFLLGDGAPAAGILAK